MDEGTITLLNEFYAMHCQPDAWNIMTLNLRHGDLYDILSLLRPFKKMRARRRPIRVLAVTEVQLEIISMFADVIDEIVYTPRPPFGSREVVDWRLATGRTAFQPGVLMTLQPADYFRWPLHPDALWFFFNDNGIALIQMFKFLLELPINIGPDLPTITEDARQKARDVFREHGMFEGRSLILMPHAYSFPQNKLHILNHFTTLAERARANGFYVYTSVAGPEEPIPGTEGVFIPFSALVPFCDLAGYLVTMRSGASDVVAAAKCRKVHIYANPRDADWWSPIGFGLGGAETNTLFDFSREYDPPRFADTILSQLRSHDPSGCVPGHIRGALAVPTSNAGQLGRFTRDEFTFLHNHRMVYTGGVLAEGWSGPEPWGIWTVGYRSILYLRPAIPTYFSAEEVNRRSVSIVIAAELAIQAETHETLEYVIEINEDRYEYIARWPDRYPLLRIPVKFSALSEPVRVTIIIKNPETAKFLAGGQSDDERLIGVGLQQARYELDALAEEAVA